jgi:hypothetical protein
MEYIYIDTDKQGEKSLYKKEDIYSMHKDDWNEIKDLPRAERNRRLFTIEEVDVIKIQIVKNTDKVRVYLGLKEPILMKEEQPVAQDHINLCADCEDDECDGTECFLPEGYVRSMVFGERSQPRIVLPFIPMQPNA